jgi:hypothetical protein
MRTSPERIQQVSDAIMKQTGFTLQQFFYKRHEDAQTIRAGIYENLLEAIQSMHDKGEAICEPFMPMLRVLKTILGDERGSSNLSQTYDAVRKIIYAHQAAFVNSEGFLDNYRHHYGDAVSDRAAALIEKKKVSQLTRDTEYLKKKFRILATVE